MALIRGLLLHIHPALERAIDENGSLPGVLDVLFRFGGPTGLYPADKIKIRNTLRTNAPRMGDRLAAQMWDALAEQTATIPGTAAAEKGPHPPREPAAGPAGPAQGSRKRD